LRAFSLDLHVLGTPPAFVLSQDQTLQLRIRFPSANPRSAPGYRGAHGSALKALRCPQYLRGLAIQFSETDRPLPTARFRLPIPHRRSTGGSGALRTALREPRQEPRTPSLDRPRTAGVAVSSRAIQGCQEATLPLGQIREFRRNLGRPGRVFQGGLTSCAPDGARTPRRTPLATRGRRTVPAAPRAPWRTPPCTRAGSLRTRPP
jgi:hypothetical protein